MRTTKSKIVAVLSAVVLVMGAFFVVKAMEKEKPGVKVEKNLTAEWFIFNSPLNPGATGYLAALKNPANYTPTHSATPPTNLCQEGDEKLCAVKALPSSVDPDQPDADQLEILVPEMTSEDPDQTIIRLKFSD